MVAHYFCIVCLCLVGIVGAFNVDRVLGRQNYNSVANIINRSGCTISNSYTNLVRDRRHVLQMAGEFDYPGMKKSTEERMTKSLENTQGSFNTLRAGGANPTILDRVSVDYYGSNTPLNQVARVAAQGAQQLVVEPFDKSILKDIEKAIVMADLNLTPTNDGSGILRINIPPLTEESRKKLVTQAKKIAEEGKVAVRNIRRDAVDKIKAAEKNKEISKDDSKDFQDDLQKVTDNYIKKLETMLKNKDKDLMTI